MRSFTFLVLLVGVLALLATVTQARRRHNFKNQQAKLEKFCLANPHHKQCSVLHVARPLSDTALRKGTVSSRFFCKALEPECGYFRSLEEKERYMRGLKSQCLTNPRNWKCEFYKHQVVFSFLPVSDKLHSNNKTVAGSPVTNGKTCTNHQNIKKQNNKQNNQLQNIQTNTYKQMTRSRNSSGLHNKRLNSVKWWRSEGNRRQRKVVRGILAHMERRPIHGVEDLPVRHEMCNKWDLW